MDDPVTTPAGLLPWASDSLGIDKRLVKACKKMGWQSPTLVQRHAIPLISKGKDVLIRARTGAGKTAGRI
jgi:superfamily II DNA/RNA helicase